MEAKISQDAPDSSLQVRTLCGFLGRLATCENAVWQPAPAAVWADIKVIQHVFVKIYGGRIHSPHLLSAVHQADEIKTTYRSSVLATLWSRERCDFSDTSV